MRAETDTPSVEQLHVVKSVAALKLCSLPSSPVDPRATFRDGSTDRPANRSGSIPVAPEVAADRASRGSQVAPGEEKI